MWREWIVLRLGLSSAFAAPPPLETVPALDLERYAGTWYELERLENRFERGCEAVTATYEPRPDGRVTVTNRCWLGSVEGRPKVSVGVARVPDPERPGELEVSFFRPFWGDYFVMALDPDYRWSLVGSPSRKYLWILSRTPTLDPAELDTIRERARAAGFDVDALRPTRQPTSPPGG